MSQLENPTSLFLPPNSVRISPLGQGPPWLGLSARRVMTPIRRDVLRAIVQIFTLLRLSVTSGNLRRAATTLHIRCRQGCVPRFWPIWKIAGFCAHLDVCTLILVCVYLPLSTFWGNVWSVFSSSFFNLLAASHLIDYFWNLFVMERQNFYCLKESCDPDRIGGGTDFYS